MTANHPYPPVQISINYPAGRAGSAEGCVGYGCAARSGSAGGEGRMSKDDEVPFESEDEDKLPRRA
jgi:hypothetical protein